MRTLRTALLFLMTGAPLGALIPNSVFVDMAITLKAGERGEFVMGDNLSNFWGNRAFRYEAGNSYYSFSDFVAFMDGKCLNREKALSTSILPHRVASIHPDGYEEIAMFSREEAMGMRVVARTPRTLGVFPLVYLDLQETEVRITGNLITLDPKRGKRDDRSAVAILAEVPVRIREITYKNDQELYKLVRFRGNTVKHLLESRQPVPELRVVIAFGRTAALAAAKARRLVAGGVWGRADREMAEVLTASRIVTGNKEYDKAVLWALASAYSLVVEEFGKGIWAGLPWFRDNWGRDTFIALPGTLLVNGRFAEAREVIENFARYQNVGEWVVRVAVPRARFSAAAAALLKHQGKILVSREGDDLLVRPVVAAGEPTEPAARRAAVLARSEVPDAVVTVFHHKDKTFGRVPNRVNRTSIIYNTADGTPWFVREVQEYLQYTGDAAFAKRIFPVVKTALNGALDNRTDAEGFLVHEEADTWMDARIEGKQAWSPRDNRAVEIQVLWYEALLTGRRLALLNGEQALAGRWGKAADRLKSAFLKRFWDDKKGLMADRVKPDNSPDYSCRPNQLLLLSVPLGAPFIPEAIGARVVRNAVEKLLYPWGVASLAQDHPWFHPHHHASAFYHNDAAYHNGTIWGWNAGFTVTALARYGQQDHAWKLSQELTRQILTLGCLGSMSENLHAFPDKEGRITLSGTYSQAWSVSEFARNAFQDYAGFRPRLLDNELVLEPAVPADWKTLHGAFRFGGTGRLVLHYSREGGGAAWRVRVMGTAAAPALRFRPLCRGGRLEVVVKPLPGREYLLQVDDKGSVRLDGEPVKAALLYPAFDKLFADLRFVKPGKAEKFPAMKKKDYLKQIILKGNGK